MVGCSHSAAAKKEGTNADIVVKQTSSGHVSVFSNCNVSMTDVIRLLRMAEMKAQKRPIPDANQLERDGEGPDEVFFFQRRQGRILSSSNTAPNTRKPQLSLEQVTATVKFALNPKAFPDRFALQCQIGECTHVRHDQCPIYDAHLERCCTIRLKMQ